MTILLKNPQLNSPKLMLHGAALGLLLALSGCGGIPTNRSLSSLRQPVVSHTTFALDVITGPAGLSNGEAKRLDGWFDAMNLRYGDRIALDDPLKSEGTLAAVARVVSRHGLELAREVPVSEGMVGAGTARVIITRALATVPGCPNWSGQNENNFNNATSPNFGCAVNSNLAAMVANPDHLLAGVRGASQTVVMSSNKAIDAYRAAKPSGDGGSAVKKSSTQGGGN
jgi:pilus assembly protein CpaD